MTLYALTQSALDQEDGPSNATRLQARLFECDIPTPTTRCSKLSTSSRCHSTLTQPPKLQRQRKWLHSPRSTPWVTIKSSSWHATQMLDTGSLHSLASTATQTSSTSSSGVSDIKSGANDATNGSIASCTGVLDAGIKAAEYCTFLDYDLNAQLGRFGLHNGRAQDTTLLNAKWESLALVPVDGKDGKRVVLIYFE